MSLVAPSQVFGLANTLLFFQMSAVVFTVAALQVITSFLHKPSR